MTKLVFEADKPHNVKKVCSYDMFSYEIYFHFFSLDIAIDIKIFIHVPYDISSYKSSGISYKQRYTCRILWHNIKHLYKY